MENVLTERQEKILYSIIDEYIQTADPVSSGAIFGIANFGVSCPTIRNEMAELTELGYLAQPHTSAGRVPTEQGYRFFVDKLMDDYASNLVKKIRRPRKANTRTNINFAAKEISVQSGDAVILADDEGEIKYFGLKKLFSNPEFKTSEAIVALIGELEKFENAIEDAFAQIRAFDNDVEVFIGSENPFFASSSYSLIVSRLSNEYAFISLLGPTRMDYRRNIAILNKFL